MEFEEKENEKRREIITIYQMEFVTNPNVPPNACIYKLP